MSTQTGANLTKAVDDLLLIVNKFVEESEKNKATLEESEKQFTNQKKEIELMNQIKKELEQKIADATKNFTKDLIALKNRKALLMEETGTTQEEIDEHCGEKVRIIKHEAELAASAEKKADKIWTCPTGKVEVTKLHSFVQQNVICSTAFSKDGSLFAAGCNKVATIYDTESGERKFRVIPQCNKIINGDEQDADTLAPEQSHIRAMSFSPISKFFATGSENDFVKLWDIHEKKFIRSFGEKKLDIYSVCFSADGRTLFASSEKVVKEWDVETGICLRQFEEKGGDGDVTTIAVSSSRNAIATGSTNNHVNVWDIRSAECTHTLNGHTKSVYSVDFSPDGTHLISGGLDSTVHVWDLNNPSRHRPISHHTDYVLSVAYLPDGRYFLTSSKDKTVVLWDAESTELVGTLRGHDNSVIVVSVSPSGGIFATGGGDNRANIWKIEY